MDTTQTTEAAVAQPSETQSTETVKTPDGTTQPDKGGEDVGAKVHRLLELGKKNPGHKYTDEELDFLDTEYHSGKTKPTKPLSVEKEDPEAGEKETKPEGEESEKKEESTEDKKPKVSKEVEDAMKEVGAKTPEELPGKIKELRRQLSGKDAQAVATLSKEKSDLDARIKREAGLYEDIRKGDPRAIQHFENTYGIKIAHPGQTQGDQKPFTDDDDALVGGALSKMWDALQAQRQTVGTVQENYQQEQKRIRESAAEEQAKSIAIDEIVTIAASYPEIAAIPNLRAVVNDWARNGKEDPRFAPLNALFEIVDREKANGETISLATAAKIKRAEEAEKLIAAAEAKGRSEAYKHKPNPSLSGVTGGKGETTHYTEEQINEMVNDHTKHPADWYDKDDNLIPSKIPAKWRSRFGF